MIPHHLDATIRSEPLTPLSAEAADARRGLPVEVLLAGEVDGAPHACGPGRPVRVGRRTPLTRTEK